MIIYIRIYSARNFKNMYMVDSKSVVRLLSCSLEFKKKTTINYLQSMSDNPVFVPTYP